MRATLSTTYRSMLNNLNRSNLRLEDLRLQAATGKRMVKPSDDPSGIRPVLNARGEIRSSERFLRTMGTATDRMNVMDGQLAQVENLMVRAKETLVASGNGALGPTDLTTLADQIRQVKEEMTALGNSQVDGKYIFSGFSETTRPFDGAPIAYQGDSNRIFLEIGPGEKVPVNLTGDALFLGAPGGVNIFETLDEIEAALRAGDSGAALSRMDALDTGADQTRRLRSEMGNIAARVENAIFNMEDMRINMKEVLARYEDADFIDTVTNLTLQETAFRAALEVTSQVSRISILDYMRR